MKDTTKFIIAQRISSVEDADKIIVLDDGKIIGMGTHNELLGSCEAYREIYETQYGRNSGDEEDGRQGAAGAAGAKARTGGAGMMEQNRIESLKGVTATVLPIHRGRNTDPAEWRPRGGGKPKNSKETVKEIAVLP